MARKVFYSFHYVPDCHRAALVRNIGVVEGNPAASSNEWEAAKKTPGGIEKWIDDNMHGKSCAVVLLGSETAGRKWINYEIIKAWNENKGVVGIHIHGLKNLNGDTSTKGANCFVGINVKGTPMSQIAKTYDPSGFSSKDIYAAISAGLATWIEEAIKLRANY